MASYIKSKVVFIPPFVSKFGTDQKDLFKKKFDFAYSFKSTNKASNGVTLESGVKIQEGHSGYVKATLVRPEGEYEAELNTDARSESKIQGKFKNLGTQNLNVTISESSLDRAFKKSPVGNLQIQYSQEFVAVEANVKSDFESVKIDGGLSVGYDGMSVGANAIVDATKSCEFQDVNLFAQYAQNDLIASVYTDKYCDNINLSAFHRANISTSLATHLRFDLAGKQQRILNVGVEHKLDTNTLVKAKVEIPTGIVTVALENNLSNPKLTWGVSSQFSAFNLPFTADKFGLSLSLGN